MLGSFYIFKGFDLRRKRLLNIILKCALAVTPDHLLSKGEGAGGGGQRHFPRPPTHSHKTHSPTPPLKTRPKFSGALPASKLPDEKGCRAKKYPAKRNQFLWRLRPDTPGEGIWPGKKETLILKWTELTPASKLFNRVEMALWNYLENMADTPQTKSKYNCQILPIEI